MPDSQRNSKTSPGRWKRVFFLLVILSSLVACGGGDTENKAEPTTVPTAQATKTPTIEAQEPTPTRNLEELSPRELGEEVGAVWIESIQKASALVVDRPPVTEIRAQVADLHETYVQRLVELGHQREVLGRLDRAAVDNAINETWFATSKTDWYDTYFEAVQYYMDRDHEFQQLLYSFNLIGQYANFDRLREQEPDEADRLGIGEPTVAETATPTATALPEPTRTPEFTLGEEMRVESGGFAFRTIQGYEVAEEPGMVGVSAPDGDPDIGPAILILSLFDDEVAGLQPLVDALAADKPDLQVSEEREVIVGDVTGVAVDLSGTDDEGRAVAGRVVAAWPALTRQFTMIGIAPSERWDGELEPLFEGVLASVNFFEPFSEMGGGEMSGVMRQWAVSATAGSEYGNPDWSASQATGAPDTLVTECADAPTAWSSEESDTLEWIELSYDTPVLPTEVNIIQTHSPGQVVKVELLDGYGNTHEIYSAEPVGLEAECPYTLSIPVVDANYQAYSVRITIDQTLASRSQIDAVELMGVADRPGITDP